MTNRYYFDTSALIKLYKEEDNSDLRTIDTNIIIQKLEENIKLRDTPAQKRFLKFIKS